MDHLPYPEDAHYPALCVPYLIGANPLRYDRLGFLDFASRAGWQTNGVAWFDCDARTAAERAQIWLYFGMLYETIGDVFEESDFTATTIEGTSFLSTSRTLPNLLRRWSGARRWRVLEFLFKWSLAMFVCVCSGGLLVFVFHTRQFKQYIYPAPKLAAKSVSALREAEAQIQRLERHHTNSSDVALTCLAIRSLLWSLRNAAVNKAFDVFKRSKLELSPDPFLHKILLERGFCTHELSSMQKNCSVAAVHYVSAYCYDNTAHQDCSEDRCNAYILTQTEYVTKHLENDCQCDLARADLDRLKRVIDSGRVPLIHASVVEGNAQLDVRPVDPDTPYVAISHAWSGGLGNPRNSSLPKCQIANIVSLLHPLFEPKITTTLEGSRDRSGSVLQRWRRPATQDSREPQCMFWMDTLCIPTRAEVAQESELRIKALSNMNRIYAEAAYVVVLDDVLKGSSRGAALQLASRVYTSSWMTRCWTYLEGRLAQNLLVTTGDALQNPFDLFYRIASYATLFRYFLLVWTDDLQLKRELSSSLYRLRSMIDDRVDDHPLENFVESLNEILRRTTSIESDVLIILALLLDLSIYEVETISDKQLRLLAIFRTQDRLPLSLLFEGLLKHHSANEHCKWLPVSLKTSVDITCGWLHKMKDPNTDEHYFRMSVRRHKTHVIRTTATRSQSVKLRLPTPDSVSSAVLMTIEASAEDGMHDNINVTDDTNTGFIYVVPVISQYGTVQQSWSGFGCRLRVVRETPKSLTLSYDGTVKYNTEHEVEGSDSMVADRDHVVLESEVVDEKKELRLETDWSQWPLLKYRRSDTSRPMTSKQGPVHAYIGNLFVLELFLGAPTLVMILLVFPLAESFASDFWWTATPIEWFVWALCITLLFLRIFVLMKVEIPVLRRQLQVMELRSWVESFAHEAPRDTVLQPQRHLSSPYQYHSWYLITTILVVSSACFALGLILDRPKLYDLSMLSAYIFLEVTVRMSIEILWRTPSFSKYRVRLLHWAFSDEAEGLPAYVLNPFSWFKSGAITRFLFSPNILSHSTDALNTIFDDPMYFPEYYIQGE